jgi:hypothetical protein
MILLIKKICKGISTIGSIIRTSSSCPGINIMPHYKVSWTPKVLNFETIVISTQAMTNVMT